MSHSRSYNCFYTNFTDWFLHLTHPFLHFGPSMTIWYSTDSKYYLSSRSPPYDLSPLGFPITYDLNLNSEYPCHEYKFVRVCMNQEFSIMPRELPLNKISRPDWGRGWWDLKAWDFGSNITREWKKSMIFVIYIVWVWLCHNTGSDSPFHSSPPVVFPFLNLSSPTLTRLHLVGCCFSIDPLKTPVESSLSVLHKYSKSRFRKKHTWHRSMFLPHSFVSSRFYSEKGNHNYLFSQCTFGVLIIPTSSRPVQIPIIGVIGVNVEGTYLMKDQGSWDDQWNVPNQP